MLPEFMTKLAMEKTFLGVSFSLRNDSVHFNLHFSCSNNPSEINVSRNNFSRKSPTFKKWNELIPQTRFIFKTVLKF